MKYTKPHSESGFNIFEILIILVIVGGAGYFVFPKFDNLKVGARQAEAKNNLAHIFTLEQVYFGDHDKFHGFDTTGRDGESITCTKNPIGFSLKLCGTDDEHRIRYGYRAKIRDDGARFTAVATSGRGINNLVYPGCPVADQWSITERKSLVNLGMSEKNCL